MKEPPAPWQIGLARLEGALPFLSPGVQTMLAGRTLCRLWTIHVRDYPFESYGLEHTANLTAHELMQTSYVPERNAFLSWVSRRASTALADAARSALAAKNARETFSEDFADADRALDHLDTHLPSSDPETTIVTLIDELIHREAAFLEGSTEPVLVLGRAIDRPAGPGAAWAASLALAMRPHLFGLGGAAYIFAGLAPRTLFRPLRETPIAEIARQSLMASIAGAAADLDLCVKAERYGVERLADRNTSSRALACWRLLVGLGPLTRAEMARGMRVTKRTASQIAVALEAAGLTQQHGRYGVSSVARDHRSLPKVGF